MKILEHENDGCSRYKRPHDSLIKRHKHEGSKEPEIANEISINYIMSKVIWNRNINDVDKFVYIQYSACYYA